MKSKILVLGFACLSLVAVAQSNEKQSKEKQNQPAAAVKSPRDIATGQASGRAMSDQKVVHRDLAARDAQSGKATGKKMAQDDWHQQRVAIGDVNGDGKADVTASGAEPFQTASLLSSRGGFSPEESTLPREPDLVLKTEQNEIGDAESTDCG